MQVVQVTFRAEELVNFTHRQMKDEEGRRIAAVEGFNMAEKRIKELNTKLTEADRKIKSIEAALEGAESQAETQRKQVRLADDELVATKEQTKVLKKKLKDAEKARDQAEQDGFDVRVAETEEALKAEVSRVCKTYCLQVWNEALNLTGVEASSALRRAENVYYPPAFGALDSSISQDDAEPKDLSSIDEISAKDLPSPNSPPKGAEQVGAGEMEKENQRRSPLKLQSLQLHPRILPREGRFPKAMSLFWQISPFLPRKNPRVKTQHPQQQQLPNPPRPQQKTNL